MSGYRNRWWRWSLAAVLEFVFFVMIMLCVVADCLTTRRQLPRRDNSRGRHERRRR